MPEESTCDQCGAQLSEQSQRVKERRGGRCRICFSKLSRPPDLNGFGSIFMLALVTSFLSAFLFLIVFPFSLSPTDGAYGQAPFSRPAVFPVALIFAGLVAAMGSPILYFCLRNHPISSAAKLIIPSALITIGVLTPRFGVLAVPIAICVVIAFSITFKFPGRVALLKTPHDAIGAGPAGDETMEPR